MTSTYKLITKINEEDIPMIKLPGQLNYLGLLALVK